MNEKITLIKLQNGQDIVGEVVGNSESGIHTITLKKPLQLITTQEGVAAIPFVLFTKDENVTIDYHHILCENNPTPAMIDSYLKETKNKKASDIIVARPCDVPPAPNSPNSPPKLYTE